LQVFCCNIFRQLSFAVVGNRKVWRKAKEQQVIANLFINNDLLVYQQLKPKIVYGIKVNTFFVILPLC